MPRGSSGWLRGSDRRERGARARQEQLVELHIYQPSTWRLPSWVNRRAVADLRPTYWESAHDGPERWEHTIEFRDDMRKRGKLAKDL